MRFFFEIRYTGTNYHSWQYQTNATGVQEVVENALIGEVKQVRWNQKGELLVFTITANRFLRGMVRAIVGTLLEVGTGKISIKEFQEIIQSKDRKRAGMNVPAEGLYLTKVKYPKKIYLLK